MLGPSGCGKSTLLRAVAGLEPLTAGGIAVDGQDLDHLPTHRRGFALMFQDGQLFGHMTVARNVGYALRLRRTPPSDGRAGPRAARAGRPRGVRRPAPGHAVRRRAAAGRPGPRARRRAAPAAARRAAVRPRRGAARAAGRRPARDPPRRRHHRPDGHPRPRGGLRRRRPAGRDARRAAWCSPARSGTCGRARRRGDGAVPRLRARAGRRRRRPSRCSTAAGLPESPAAVAVRRSALVATAGDAPRHRRVGPRDPELVRLVVAVDGIGPLDAVAPRGSHVAPGRAGAAAGRSDPGRGFPI